MKQRIISALLGLCVLGFVLAFYETAVFNIAVTLLIVMAMYELFKAAKLTQYKPLFALCLVFSVLVPLMQTKHLSNQLALICGAYAFLLFCALIRYHDTLHIEQLSLAFFFGLMIPFSFSTLLFMHDRYVMPVSMLYLLITLGGAWLTDTGAYFVGCKFGKHKMAPTISPKKTIEGAIGGILCNLICYYVLTMLYITVADLVFGITIQVNYLALGCLAPLASLAGILGDLSASVIKRQCGIKDFGSIMPGHGGVMDRFDSVLFVAPTVFMYIQYVDLFKIVR
ncbi:phosphatidate cytidylyltransferase [Hydrogenoanaerobacterium sp.]|uniref:phosphatidate cytidylyltransferase n=1 Tax=Hydrogenoanaerobacterium sp. TaxID=2953763 RepID=UPI0028973F22|nr:phosphatidate cytidylyltransferase [Hydrogenoanaerobacterium sp.]